MSEDVLRVTVSVNGGPALPMAEAADMLAASMREQAIAEAQADGSAKLRREGLITDESKRVIDQIAERALMLMARRDAINQDIRDLFGFAKDIGFHAKALRAAIADLRKLPEARKEEEAQREIYRAALGVEGPDFVIALPCPAATPPKPERRITAREKTYRDSMALIAASRIADAG